MSAWSKIWQNIGWQNKPSRLTPLGKSNLDKLDTFNDAIDDRVVEIYNMKGSNNGLAELDANGFVPSTQLPSFVDDIIEGEAQNVTQESSGMFSATGFIKAGESSPTTLESNKVYLDTSRRIQFRWTGTGSNLVSIGSGLTLGETQFTAYRGDRGKTAYDHATDASRNTTTQQAGLYKFGVTSEGHVSSPTEMTAEDLQNAVGLGDVAFISTPENPTQVKYLREDGTWDVPEGQSIAGTQTVTGNPITLTDAAPINAESLVVELKPKQDLHGYDFPWVGGAGRIS